MDAWVELLADPIPIATAVQRVGDESAGGIAMFLGTTRAQRDGGRDLVALDYEAYREMALAQMRQYAHAAGQKFGLKRVVILHRVGRVAVGEPSVLIAASAAHRKEAIAACEWMIDTLKGDAAIWKREVWEGE